MLGQLCFVLRDPRDTASVEHYGNIAHVYASHILAIRRPSKPEKDLLSTILRHPTVNAGEYDLSYRVTHHSDIVSILFQIPWHIRGMHRAIIPGAI